MRRLLLVCVALALGLAAAPAWAIDEAGLKSLIEQRFKGDRTGACIAAAFIETGAVVRAHACADTANPRRFDDGTAFEIGSVSKTMTAALLAARIARGELALDDPLARLLPSRMRAPAYGDRQITLAHVVTHTSGLPRLPPQWRVVDPRNPYASLTEADLRAALIATRLERAPGTAFEYSNFAIMVLSLALARRSGKDFETLLREELFLPLAMHGAYIARPPRGVRLAQGHISSGRDTPPWDFPVDMAGVGGVRATLGDMVRYVEAQLGARQSAITPALVLSQKVVSAVAGQTMGMGWFLSTVDGYRLVFHEGATGGYSSFVGFDPTLRRGVVLLSDTALVTTGGLEGIALRLLGAQTPVGEPRRPAQPDAALLDALAGRYRLEGGLGMQLRRKAGVLAIKADGQPEFTMGYDSAGDFYPLEFDALLRPKRKADGTYAFIWSQLGGVQEATRIAPAGVPPLPKPPPPEAQLKEYEGTYPLLPAFALRVYATGAKLFVQGTGQMPLEVAFVDQDAFVAETVGAEIAFERDAAGKVVALTLKQSGQVLRGPRQ